MSRIVIADRDPQAASRLVRRLFEAGLPAERVEGGCSACQAARAEPQPSLLVLDLSLPDMSGFEVCKELRSHPDTEALPILFLSDRTAEVDRVVAFELGADDYVCKPFSEREFVLRVRALLRRIVIREIPSTPAVPELVIDSLAHEVRLKGQCVALTALEFKLLYWLASRRGRVQTRERLLEEVWGDQWETSPRTIDTHMRRLRVKLGEAARDIETVHGLGYKFRETSHVEVV